MKQAIAIIAVVAILGVIGLGATKQSGSSPNLAPAAPAAVTTSTSSANTSPPTSSAITPAAYKDGTYAGASVDNEFGTVRVAAVISGGKITDIRYLEMPSGRGHTQEVTAYAEPTLKSEAISSQNANIDFISGATVTSASFERSLQAALNQAVQS